MNRIQEFLNFSVTASEDSSVKKLAEAIGLQLPSQSFAVFKSIYAKIEDANKNGVRLARTAVEESLPTLIGTQVNLNHWRKNYIVGNIFWAGINENDEIEIAFTFFKSVYPEDYERAIKQLEDGELTVSFELSADRDSQMFHSDGTRTLHEFYFDGVGLLLDENPAYPGAVVYETAKELIDDISKETNLVFANQTIDNDKYLNLIANLKSILTQETKDEYLNMKKEKLENHSEVLDEANEEGRKKEMSKEMKKVEDIAEVLEEQTDIQASDEEIKEEKDDSKEEVESEEVEDVSEVEEVEVQPEEIKEEKDDSKEEVESEEVEDEASSESEEAKTVVETEKTEKVVEVIDDKSQAISIDSEVIQKVTDSEGNEVVNTRKEKMEETFTFAQVEEIKAEYEAKIAELENNLANKEDEIEKAKETAVQIERLKVELGTYVKDFTDEDFANIDKVEIARLRKERDELKSKSSEPVIEETIKKETIVASVQEETDLETGHEETEEVDNPQLSLVEAVKARIDNKENKK